MPVITAHMVLLNLQRQRSDRGQFQLENGFESKECVAGRNPTIAYFRNEAEPWQLERI